MLKFLFWSLFLANIGLLMYQQGYLESWIPDGHEPARMSRQAHAELMKPIAGSEIATLATDTNTHANPISAAVKEAAKESPKSEALACKEIGNFDAASAKRFETLIQPLALGDKVSHRDIAETANNIVYIPSQGSKEGAEKKASELRHFGVNDFYIIQDAGPFHWGISLGVFKSEEAARSLLTALNQKGVHSARLGIHNVGSTKTAYQLRNLDATAIASVDKIVSEFQHIDAHGCDANPGADSKTVAHAALKQNLPRDLIR
jgi:hypothetical protein